MHVFDKVHDETIAPYNKTGWFLYFHDNYFEKAIRQVCSDEIWYSLLETFIWQLGYINCRRNESVQSDVTYITMILTNSHNFLLQVISDEIIEKLDWKFMSYYWF